jgi:hypothetical protein
MMIGTVTTDSAAACAYWAMLGLWFPVADEVPLPTS